MSKRVRDAHTRRKCSAHAPGTIVGRRGHHHDVRNGLGAAEMPRRVEHTQPVTRRTFPPRAQPLTHARTPALRQHPRTTQWDRVTRGRARSWHTHGIRGPFIQMRGSNARGLRNDGFQGVFLKTRTFQYCAADKCARHTLTRQYAPHKLRRLRRPTGPRRPAMRAVQNEIL